MVGRAISFSPRRPRVGKARPPRATLCPVTWVDPDGLPFGGAGAGLMAGPSLRQGPCSAPRSRLPLRHLWGQDDHRAHLGAG